MAVPTYVVDAPSGGGKIPVMPNYLISSSDKRVVLRNYEGKITTYSQPENIYVDCWCELCKAEASEAPESVAKCLEGRSSIRPGNSDGENRLGEVSGAHDFRARD